MQFLASGFVYFVSLVSAFRRSVVTSAKSRYTYAVCVALLVGILTWCTPFTQQSDKANLNALFQIADPTKGKIPLNDPTPYVDLFAPFRSPNRFACVAFLWFVKFVNTAVSLSLPMPCGIYLPLLVMSAAFGRFFGEVVNAAVPGTPDAGLFAFVSAAATLSGITHSISSCVIVMEMTAQANNVLPLIVTVVVAYTVSGLFTISVYDMFMELGEIRAPWRYPCLCAVSFRV
jgi:chloride channel 2